MGGNRKRGVASFGLFASLFVDDLSIFFETREDMVTETPYLFSHLRKFGLEMHVRSGTAAPKTEAMYYPTGTVSCGDGSTIPFEVSGPGGENPGFVGSTRFSST